MSGTIRIVIADDHQIFRDGLRKLLQTDAAFEVAGEARNGPEAVSLVERLRPDVLLLDLAMPGGPGLDALRRLADAGVPTRTVLLTAAISRREIVMALQLGARGVILKDSATRLLFECIHRVVAGEYWLGQENVANLVTSLREQSAAARTAERVGLTSRELEIIRQVAEGACNRDIASALNVSEQTVKNHLSHIFDKTGVGTRLELALYAIHHALLRDERIG